MNKNEEFDNATKEEQLLEAKRQEQHITPLLNSLGVSWKYFAKHTSPQVKGKVDGVILLDREKPIYFENKCLRKDWPNAYFEMWIERENWKEQGWATRNFNPIISKHPIYLINAYESFVKIYDLKETKKWINSLTLEQFKALGGFQVKTWDSKFKGWVYGWNAPFAIVEKFEIKDFGKVVRSGRM